MLFCLLYVLNTFAVVTFDFYTVITLLVNSSDNVYILFFSMYGSDINSEYYSPPSPPDYAYTPTPMDDYTEDYQTEYENDVYNHRKSNSGTANQNYVQSPTELGKDLAPIVPPGSVPGSVPGSAPRSRQGSYGDSGANSEYQTPRRYGDASPNSAYDRSPRDSGFKDYDKYGGSNGEDYNREKGDMEKQYLNGEDYRYDEGYSQDDMYSKGHIDKGYPRRQYSMESDVDPRHEYGNDEEMSDYSKDRKYKEDNFKREYISKYEDNYEQYDPGYNNRYHDEKVDSDQYDEPYDVYQPTYIGEDGEDLDYRDPNYDQGYDYNSTDPYNDPKRHIKQQESLDQDDVSYTEKLEAVGRKYDSQLTDLQMQIGLNNERSGPKMEPAYISEHKSYMDPIGDQTQVFDPYQQTHDNYVPNHMQNNVPPGHPITTQPERREYDSYSEQSKDFQYQDSFETARSSEYQDSYIDDKG